MIRKWLPLVVFACCWLALPTDAGATPWVLEEDEIAVTGRFDYQRADQEFFGPGEKVDYSLNGEYEATTFELSARLGLVDRLEMQLAIPIKNVSYRADPVILLPCEEQTLDCSQENVNDLSQTTSGVGDIRLGSRYQFLEGPLAGAFELMIKTPTGYDRPSGTFGDEPKSAGDFQENITTYAQPDNIEDDVTLGDGQLDIGAKAKFGWSLPSRTFIRLDAGYLLRLAGAGDQVNGHLQLGQAIGQRLLLIGGASLDYAVQDGEVIGVSVAAEDPSLPAEDYEGTKNLRLREVPLDEDRLKVHGGVLLRMTDQTELKLNYSRIVWGRNTALTQTLSIGFGVKFDLAEQTAGE
jgi:hypothetical protein